MKLNKKIEPKENLDAAFEDCRRRYKKDRFFVVFIDGNGIKAVNDNYGHLMGDKVIARLADLIAESVRDNDRVIRFGGDEFVLFLNNFDKAYVRPFIERIQERIRSDKQLLKDVGGVSVSAGIVGYEEDYHAGLERVLEEADQLMYAAKLNPPHYLVFSEDIINPPEVKSNRKEDLISRRKRSYFSWVVCQIMEENPKYNHSVLMEAARLYFRSNQNKVVYYNTTNAVINGINSNYQILYKRALRKLLEQQAKVLMENPGDKLDKAIEDLFGDNVIELKNSPKKKK